MSEEQTAKKRHRKKKSHKKEESEESSSGDGGAGETTTNPEDLKCTLPGATTRELWGLFGVVFPCCCCCCCCCFFLCMFDSAVDACRVCAQAVNTWQRQLKRSTNTSPVCGRGRAAPLFTRSGVLLKLAFVAHRETLCLSRADVPRVCNLCWWRQRQ